MNGRQRLAGLVVVSSFLLIVPELFAQASSGITGVVRDASGGVLPGVNVDAESPALIEKVRSAVTDGQGTFRIVGLVPGVYTVTFSLTGFNTFKREGIELGNNFTATVNADLRVGGIEETITVSGQSPVVDVSNAAARNQITREALDTVPTNKTLEAFAALTPGVTMAAIGQDVGGSKGETYVQLRIHGTRTGDNKTLLDGFETNDYSGRVFVPNPAAASEVSIELGNGPGEAPANGVYVNFVPRDGGNLFHGSLFGTYTGPGFQSEPELSDVMLNRGLTQGDLGKVIRIWDANGSLGGPIKRDRIWFHQAVRSWGSANAVVGAYYNLTPTAWTYRADTSRPANDDFNNYITSTRFTVQASEKHKVNVSYDYEYRCDCHRSVSSTLAPEASAERLYYPKVLGITWDHPATSRLLFSAGTASNWMGYGPYPQDETPLDTISVVEQSNSLRYRSVGVNSTAASAGYGEKYNFIQASRFSAAYVTGSHNFKTGIQLRQGYKRYTSEGAPIEYAFRNEAPVQLTMVTYPLTYSANMRAQMGIYAQDQWTLNRFTLNLGLRYDYQNSYVPDQHLPAGPFTGERNFEEVTCVPCWNDWSPRGSAIWDVFGNGKTAVKVSSGRYITENMLVTADAANPLVASNPSTNRAWTDSNRNFVPDCDLLNPALNGECGPYSNANFGRNVITTRYDDSVLRDNRAASWASSLVFQHELRRGMALNVGYFHTSWSNFTIGTPFDNLNVLPTDYSPYCITLPQDPLLPNGGGNQVCGLYNLNPDKFGDTSNILVTSADKYGDEQEIYDGFDVTLNARFGPGAFVQGGMSSGRTLTDNCYVVDSPQSLSFCRVEPPMFQPQWKFSGSYPLPWWQLQLSGVFQSLPGIPVSASYVATNAQVQPSLGRPLSGGQTTVTINNVIEQQQMFEDRYYQTDLRVIRNFRFSGTRLQVMFDMYNMFNNAGILAINTRYGTSYRRPTTILDARILKLGAQVNF
jgi:hypothetical protein